MTLHTIETAGARFAVEDTGSSDPALVFLHDWGGSARTWDPVVACRPASVRSIALNQRGWGGSTATDSDHELDALAYDVLAVDVLIGERDQVEREAALRPALSRFLPQDALSP